MARLPEGAERSVADSLKEKRALWPWGLLLLAELGVAAGIRWGGLFAP